MKNDFQRKDEINQLIKKYKETKNELTSVRNKKQAKIGIICFLVLLIIMYIGLYIWGQNVIMSKHKFCGGPTEGLGNTM